MTEYVRPTGIKRLLYYVAFILGVGAFPFHHYVSFVAGGIACLAMLWQWPKPPATSNVLPYSVYSISLVVYLAGLIWM
jgi:hypothetical protein